MIPYERLDGAPVENSCRLHGVFVQCIEKQVPQGTAEPVVRGNVEPALLAVQHGRRQLTPHQFLQNELLPESADLESCRSPGAESTIRRSRNGGRTSIECAMLIRSVLYRMSSGR